MGPHCISKKWKSIPFDFFFQITLSQLNCKTLLILRTSSTSTMRIRVGTEKKAEKESKSITLVCSSINRTQSSYISNLLLLSLSACLCLCLPLSTCLSMLVRSIGLLRTL